jgi:hypothetical protein
MQQQRVTANAEIVRVFGYFSLIIAAACCVLFIANMRARVRFGASDLSPLGWIAAYAVIGGWGTVRLKRWGAVMLAAPLTVAGVVFGLSSVRQQPTLWVAAIAIGWIVVLSVPAIFCVRSWRDLS